VGPSFGVTAREEKPAPAGTVWQVRQVEGKSDEPQKPGKTRATRPSRRTWLIVNARQGEFTLFSACPYGRITVLPHDNQWRGTHYTL